MLLALLACASPFRAAVAADAYSEDSVRAAYLYRFAGYVAWPDAGPADAPFVIDVLGSPSMARELRRILATHSINGRAAQVREIASLQEVGSAQILYVAEGQARLLRELRPDGRAAMLLVTAEEHGLSTGGVINFVTVDRSVRFEVSLAAAERWRLKISSDLLGVAVRVQSGHGQDG
jgi:YfiR/HmsC-like